MPWLDPSIEVRDILYEFDGHDFGIRRDDEDMLKEPCIVLTRNEDGSNPFLCVPKRCVKEVD